MTIKKLSKIVFLATATLVLGACGNGGEDSQKEDNNELVTEITDDTSIVFWHAMNGEQEAALTKITEDFMAENPKIEVKLQNQSSYPDLQAKVNSTLPSPKDLPTITQAYPGWLWGAVQDEMLVDLTPYMENETIGLSQDAPIKESLLEGAQIEGVQYGMPFNKSTEVLFYNKDILDEYGLAVPNTLEGLATASETIYEESSGEVVGAGFDSLNNYYVIGMKNKGEDFTQDLAFDSATSKEVVNYYADGVKAGYFRIAGSDQYMSGPFANQQVAMFVGSIAGETYVAGDAEGKFEYGIAPRPEAINLQQGTDIYMFDSATAEEKTAAYLFMKYLATPEVQLEWATATGYMPILDSVINSEEYQQAQGTKVPPVLEEATKELFTIPVTETSNAAYNEVRAIMESILTSKADDRDKQIETGASQLENAWNQ